MPDLYIITGSNGAGKSTVGPNYLPAPINEKIFDGDKLFIEKRSELWKTLKAPKEVAKLAFVFTVETLEQQVEEALAAGRDYAYEGHFTNNETWEIPRRFKMAGYTINVVFFGLRDPDTSQLRVYNRAQEGGHWVDRQTIENNFYGNLEKLQQHIDLIDNLQIIDTSEANHKILASFLNGEAFSTVRPADLPDWFTNFLPGLAQKIINSEQ